MTVTAASQAEGRVNWAWHALERVVYVKRIERLWVVGSSCESKPHYFREEGGEL